jgi:hypothetical protein
MGSLEERITAYATACAKLITQLRELDSLRERLKKAKERYNAIPKRLKRRPANSDRRAHTSRADWR